MTLLPSTLSEGSATERRRLQARARRLTQRALILAGAGKLAEAIQCQDEVTALRPQDAAAFFRLGMLCREAHRTEQAVEALRRSTHLSPGDRDPREALTETLVEASRYDEAVLEARALLKIVPRSLFARDALSIAYLQLGKIEKALQVTGEMVWLDPLNPGHHFRRGLLFQQQGNLRAAVGEYSRALDMAHPESETYGDAEDALEMLDDEQTRQILLLASGDWFFLLKLRQDPAEAVTDRGFCLSEDGLARLQYILPHEFPEWAIDRAVPVSWGAQGRFH